MNSFQDFKKEINLFLIVSALAVILTVSGILLLKKVEPNQVSPIATVSDNTFSTSINGYFETRVDNSAVYKRVSGSWEDVSNKLPNKGLYYLDNRFVGYGMCDVVVCQELPNPYAIKLVEYEKVGEKPPPAYSGSTADVLPVYETLLLHGDIRIDLQYFTDKNCRNEKTFSAVHFVE